METYQDYLNTPHWKKLRSLAVETHGAHCHCCGSTKGVEVHHISYAKGWGAVTLDDLMPLCGWHHSKIHGEKRLDWMLGDALTSPDIKRKVILYYLRYGSVPTIERAEEADEQSCKKPVTARKKRGRKIGEPKKKIDRVIKQAKQTWSAGRISVREKAMKEFGWTK